LGGEAGTLATWVNIGVWCFFMLVASSISIFWTLPTERRKANVPTFGLPAGSPEQAQKTTIEFGI
jgi:hypothetical protein